MPSRRILHADGDSFFASCEIALHPQWEGREVWVGGGRRGDGIVIAANRHAKKRGVNTGMACFEAKRLCPRGILARPHYDAYRELSKKMFLILEEYTPTLVPASIDEGFLDFTGMETNVWRHTTPKEYVEAIRWRIRKEIDIPVSAGLANSSQLAKLTTDAAKPGFLEIPAGQEKEFLHDRPLSELSGVGKRRTRTLAGIGARTFGDVARMPSTLFRQKFGIWGTQLWLLANGKWSEPITLESKDRTTISSNTTLPYDEPDYQGVLTFIHSEAVRMIGQLRREHLQVRELGLAIRFNDFTERGDSHRFLEPQFKNSVINDTLEEMFHEIMRRQSKSVRQIRISCWNLSRMDVHPVLFGKNEAEKCVAIDHAVHRLNRQFEKLAVMTGAEFALRQHDDAYKNPKAKCPFAPQREIVQKLWGTERDPAAPETEVEKRLARVSRQHGFHQK